MRDVAEKIGLSNNVLRMIESRQFWDKMLLYGGMLLTLAEANVRTLDDLADLDNEELVEILAEHELTDDTEAGDIIMAARAHWFKDEEVQPEIATEQSDTANADVVDS